MDELEYARIAEYYDHVGPYAARPDVDFWVEEALASDGPVLELGCGTGRVLVPTARAGVTIVGLDASSDMLTVCRDKMAAESEDVRKCVSLVDGTSRPSACAGPTVGKWNTCSSARASMWTRCTRTTRVPAGATSAKPISYS